MKKDIWEIKSLKEYKELNRDMFKDYKATLQELEGNDRRNCIVTFRRDDTSCAPLIYTYVDGVLTVNGVYGYAMFSWSNKNNHILAYSKFNNLEYILSKIIASESYVEFDINLFHKDLKDFILSIEEDGYITNDRATELLDDIDYMEDSRDVYDYFKDFIDVHDYEVHNFGKYISERAYVWWYGLQCALNQLKNNGCFKNE